MKRSRRRTESVATTIVAGMALIAAFAIAIPAVGSQGGATMAKKKKKAKRGPAGPKGDAGATGATGASAIAVRGFATDTNNDNFSPGDGHCFTDTYTAPGVQAGDVVALNIVSAPSAGMGVMPATSTTATAGAVNVQICNNSGGAVAVTDHSVTLSFVAFR